VGIGPAKEGLGADALDRLIRPPAEVLVAPRSGTCLDLAVVLAAAALHAGLQAAVLVLAPEATGRAELAVVAVLLDAAWPEPLTADRAWPTPPPDLLLAAQRALDGPPRPLLVLDPRDLTRSPGADLAQAALDGYALLGSSDLHPRACVRARRRPDAHRQPTVTGPRSLRAPYRAPESAESALRLLRAEYGVTPFQARDELTVLRQIADEAARDGRMSVAVVTGRGGAGKTRLALQLIADLNADGWYGGALRERPDRPDGLVPVVAPVAVVVDYAEVRPQRVRELLSTLGRRESATLVVLTARSDDGDWLSMIDDTAAVHPWRYELLTLPDAHSRADEVYQLTFAALRGGRLDVAPDGPPDLPEPVPGRRWTTLDLVLLGWLAAVSRDRLPHDRGALYATVLVHERRYWARTFAEITGSAVSYRRLLDDAAALRNAAEPGSGRRRAGPARGRGAGRRRAAHAGGGHDGGLPRRRAGRRPGDPPGPRRRAPPAGRPERATGAARAVPRRRSRTRRRRL
jgi:hypothetical protein